MEFLASLFGGTALGVLGSIWTGILAHFKQKQADRHQMEVLAAQRDFAIAAGNNTLAIEAYRVMGGSYEVDKEAYVSAKFPSVDWFRGMVRPCLVAMLSSSCVVLALWSFYKVGIETYVVENIVDHSIKALIRFTEFSIGWYFGNRQVEQFIIKHGRTTG